MARIDIRYDNGIKLQSLGQINRQHRYPSGILLQITINQVNVGSFFDELLVKFFRLAHRPRQDSSCSVRTGQSFVQHMCNGLSPLLTSCTEQFYRFTTAEYKNRQ
ncbi:hypothetical protein D3C76_1620310 [compost metagenome]